MKITCIAEKLESVIGKCLVLLARSSCTPSALVGFNGWESPCRSCASLASIWNRITKKRHRIGRALGQCPQDLINPRRSPSTPRRHFRRSIARVLWLSSCELCIVHPIYIEADLNKIRNLEDSAGLLKLSMTCYSLTALTSTYTSSCYMTLIGQAKSKWTTGHKPIFLIELPFGLLFKPLMD